MKKQITAYRLGGVPFEIRPAPHTREWMDQTNKRYAYRCLPLVAANCYGWELLCPEEVDATWNGQSELDAIDISPKVPWLVSHFGYGIVTFQIPYLFRTSADADLLVSGPVNRWGKNATPLEGIVETSWSPMTFTMNWQIDWATTVGWEKGEPICRIVPVAREFLADFEACIVEHEDMPAEIANGHREWSTKRHDFLDQLRAGDPDAARAGWQRDYFKQAKATKLPEFQTT